ncbi:hypothetical protein ScPMuIL_011326 [Solemya velum]
MTFRFHIGEKGKEDYKKVFWAVSALVPDAMVVTFVVDFESGLYQGLHYVFGDPVIHGSTFFFSQTL